MRRVLFATIVLIGPVTSSAQERSVSRGIPTEIAAAVSSVYNASDTRRERGPFDLKRDSAVEGSLAVRGGRATVAGRITGSLVVINADLVLLDGARISGNVYVVGGRIEGADPGNVSGDISAYAETLRYRMRGDELVVEESDEMLSEEQREERRREDRFWGREQRDNYTDLDFFTLAGIGAYNRVEGYPFLIGPRFRMRRDWGRLWLHARGVLRTAEPMEWDRGTTGHDARVEVRFGNGLGIGIGATAFDVVDAVQSWQLSDHETALAAAVLHRDYRDYYGKHGGRAFISGFVNDAATLRLGYGRERWASRDERDPWSLFRSSESWRENPRADEGHVNLITGSLVVDTRSNSYSPGAGWYLQADVERGDFDQELATGIAKREYTRGFIDARRYNRLAPGAQLNLRVVVGGWVDGDPLPLQRRLSVGGAGTLPGFDFGKSTGRGADRLQCSEGSTPQSQLPALCDRIALAQVEYRGDLSWHSHGDDDGWWPQQLHTPTWVVFADAGRGWRAKDDGVTTHPIQSFPDLKTFETDIGVGLDFGSASLSIAKSLSDRTEPANVVVRLSRRF
jgi:hypothetical protein